jgi:hypothetical protein
VRYLLVLQCVLEGLLLTSYSISFEAKLMTHGESSTCTQVDRQGESIDPSMEGSTTCTQVDCLGESIDPSMEEVLHAHKWIVFVRSSGD